MSQLAVMSEGVQAGLPVERERTLADWSPRDDADQSRSLVILGSTGSIGTQALDLISRHRDRFQVTGLAAGGAHVRSPADLRFLGPVHLPMKGRGRRGYLS